MYHNKLDNYFAGVRHDFLDLLDCREGRILEIGCGAGDTGQYALKENLCNEYYGIELQEKAGSLALAKLTEVIVGDVEKMPLPWSDGFFDALLLSEVLEHLVDPWSVLEKLKPLLKSNALVFASSPNVCHHSVVRMLLRGHWNLTDVGIMDRTHLRWFTPASYKKLFVESGFNVENVLSVSPMGRKSRILCTLSMNKYEYLFWRQIKLIARA